LPIATPAFRDEAVRGGTLTGLLHTRSATSPNKTVLRFLGDHDDEERSLSYAQLDRGARAIAARLDRLGARGERVLLLHPPGPEYITALFGCLYAGAVAVPAYPPRSNRPMLRLRSIATGCRPRFALTTEAALERAQPQLEREPELAQLTWLASDRMDADGVDWRPPEISPDDLALLQFTSGSVSAPKGVMLTQGHFLRNIAAMLERGGGGSDDRWVSWLPPYHDMGLVGAILTPLVVGGEVTFLSPGEFLQRPARWLSAISRYRATVSGGPNFAYELCVRRVSEEQRRALDLSSWRFAFCGAERVRPETIERFCALFEPAGFRRSSFVPSYGLAEATLGVSYDARPPTVGVFDDAELGRGRAESPRPGGRTRSLAGCGKPLPGCEVLIVDPETRAPLPERGLGEIWVASSSVALGYWPQPAASDEIFRARLSTGGDTRYLRTGDLGFLAGGELFVVARLKDLIILGGVNHYAEDIEGTVERCHPGLRVGGTAAFSVEGENGEQLVIVQEIDSGQRADAGSIAAAIRTAVAEHHELAIHDLVLVGRLEIPRTSSGKTQRSLCRQQYLEGALSRVADAPGSIPSASAAPPALVEEIARTMAELVGVTRVLPEDDFFHLGGHSLMATQLVARLSESLRREIPLRAVFEAPTPLALAAWLVASPPAAALAPIVPIDRRGPLRLSFAQERMWFLHQIDPGSAAYNVAGAVALEGSVDRQALDRTFAEIGRRHEILRTRYRVVEGEPRIEVDPDRTLLLETEDFSGRADAPALASAAASALAQEPFDVTGGQLVRAGLYRIASDRHVLAVSMHHLVTDAWSMGLLLKEFARLYPAFLTGSPLPPPDAGVTYIDYAQWQRDQLSSERLAADLAYWKAQLSGAEPLALPSTRPRSRRRSSAGALERFPIDAELMRTLHEFGSARGATAFMVSLTAFLVALHRHTGQTDMVVGVPVANRRVLASERFIGTLTNTLAVRVRFDPDISFSELLRRVREVAITAYEHQDLPFERLVAEMNVQRAPGTPPLIQAMFDYQNAPIGALDAGGLRARPIPLSRGATQFDLSLLILDAELGQSAGFEYSTDLFDADTIRRFALHYLAVLEGALVEPGRPISRLPLLSGREQQEILSLGRQSCRGGPAAPSLLQRFAAHVAATPDAPAVSDAQGVWSYRELDRQARSLAADLRARGVGPGRRVAVCVERSRALPACLLGILQTGAAYVPIDPRHPAARIRLALEDAAPSVVVSQAGLAEGLGLGAGTVVVDLDATRPDAALLPPPPADAAAYVIYTSGSTGPPKGVEIGMPALANFLQSMSHTPGLAAGDRLLGLTTIAFDIAGLELFLPLYTGASVHVAGSDVAIDGPRLIELYQRVAPTMVQATPATWRLLIEAGWRGDPGLTVLCGGESLPAELAAQLLERCRILWNVYGPTETTIWSTLHPVGRGEDPVPIGTPIDETPIYILDRHGQLCPLGVAGELHIGGVGLANGYFRRPELTAERFVQDPFAAGARLYRTGDLARLRPDGKLEHLGRLDRQIKIRGFRIEPGEIEAGLKQHPAVADALVVIREDRPGEPRLVAYVVPRGPQAPSATLLRDELRTKVPDYMVPAAFVSLPAFPQTPNKKIDRARLPAPDLQDLAVATVHVAPRDLLEERLARLWTEVLGISNPGIRDDFFSLGGHSLLAVRLFARIHQELGVELPLALLFEAPTIEGLTAALRARAVTTPKPAFNHLVLVQRGGARAPFFCVHGAGGNVLNLAALARHLGTERPFYGIQARGVDGRSEPYARIEEMAAAYLAEVREVQPRGPYLLSGYCGGGAVAFEMAHLLREAGESVELLALLDTYHPRIDMREARRRQLRAGISAEGMHYILRRARARLGRHLADLTTRWRIRWQRLLGRVVPVELRDYWLTQAFFRAELRYDPRPYPGPLFVLRAREVLPLSAHIGSDLGWSGLAEGLDAHEVPGNHETFVLEPNVQEVASILNARLEKR
jgi:amino acid adenylation domain-containing protein